MALSINFVSINVNAVNREGMISIGENNQPGWSAHGKTMFGNCQVIGMSLIANVVNNMMDSDILDSPIEDQDMLPTMQSQTA